MLEDIKIEAVDEGSLLGCFLLYKQVIACISRKKDVF
jgi:hypothetical protein